MTLNWGALLVAQLEFYWEVHLRPRLEGLGDEEYFWEPVEESHGPGNFKVHAAGLPHAMRGNM